MSVVCPILMRLLIAGILMLALMVQADTTALASPAVGTEAMNAVACCADANPIARATCEMPCLCLQALPGIPPELEVRQTDRFCAPLTPRLAEWTHDPDPLPPRSPAA